MIRLALFDCDGTLADGQAAIFAAMEDAFAAQHMPPPDRAAIRAIIGLSLESGLMRLTGVASQDTILRLAEGYRRSFRAARAAGSVEDPLYPGIADCLARIEADGWTLGIATGRSRRGVEALLRREGWTGRFATIVTPDLYPSKPDPAMLRAAMAESGAEAVVMIGDTGFDMAMACAARPLGPEPVKALGVAWGYQLVDVLWAAGADAVASDPAGLAAMLAGSLTPSPAADPLQIR